MNASRSTRRGGFTLLETLLAASLGAALVLMVVGLMGFMDRAEARQASRLEQVDGMARLHKVMSRVFSTLVVADPNSGTAFRNAVEGQTPGAKQGEPAHVLLEPDESRSLHAALRRARVGGGGAVQRLEVVLERPPVPRSFARGMTGALSTSLQSNSDERDDDDRPLITGPVRGVFELRPDAATLRISGGAAPVDDGRIGWTLWWRPLIDEQSLAIDPTEDPEAVPIVSGLAQCNWKAFIKRKREDRVRVVTNLELPAYMEMEARTLGGQYASWMFEVQWSIQPSASQEGQAPEGGRFKAKEAKPEEKR